MKIGYVRVSTQEQNEILQVDALKKADCEKFFTDKGSGAKFERKGLEQLLAFVRSGDTVVVWKLDRLGRSLKDLIFTLNVLKERGVDFLSLTEKIDSEWEETFHRENRIQCDLPRPFPQYKTVSFVATRVKRILTEYSIIEHPQYIECRMSCFIMLLITSCLLHQFLKLNTLSAHVAPF